ncbi:hypothetical protein [Desulfovibrio inopinatus]|uniref:hypothetical protein n=1 Tax=Desulfovibrio inopinatus TaxID=102109 RepID=UPI0004262903|nr:hypothetical protein [Desulfovibrio inopinatus]
MERALLKLARQLGAYDEASLMALWEKYAELVRQFEPTKRWEEAVIVLNLIQAVRFKNQLFNYHWSQTNADAVPHPTPPRSAAGGHGNPFSSVGSLESDDHESKKKGKLLSFTPKSESTPDDEFEDE